MQRESRMGSFLVFLGGVLCGAALFLLLPVLGKPKTAEAEQDRQERRDNREIRIYGPDNSTQTIIGPRRGDGSREVIDGKTHKKIGTIDDREDTVYDDADDIDD